MARPLDSMTVLLLNVALPVFIFVTMAIHILGGCPWLDRRVYDSCNMILFGSINTILLTHKGAFTTFGGYWLCVSFFVFNDEILPPVLACSTPLFKLAIVTAFPITMCIAFMIVITLIDIE